MLGSYLVSMALRRICLDVYTIIYPKKYRILLESVYEQRSKDRGHGMNNDWKKSSREGPLRISANCVRAC